MPKPPIAIVFDFDLTLSPEIMLNPVLRSWGMGPDDFWASCTRLQAGEEGFDMENSYLFRMVEEGRRDTKRRLDDAKLEKWGREVKLYPGLEAVKDGSDLFASLEKLLGPGVFEAYVVSGGLQGMVKGCLSAHGIARFFKALFACRLATEDPGDGLGLRFSFPKETVNFTMKTQKLFAVSKGAFGPGAPHVNDRIPKADFRVPFSNMLYLGDGQSDIAAFALLKKYGGTCFAVHGLGDLKAREKAKKLARQDERAHGYFEADYSEGSALRKAIFSWAQDKIGKQGSLF